MFTLSSAHQAAVAGMRGAQSGFSWLFMYLLFLFVSRGCVHVYGAAYVCTGVCVCVARGHRSTSNVVAQALSTLFSRFSL